MKPTVSIIVPSRGRTDKLAALLECLARQQGAEAASFEVVVALDGCDRADPIVRSQAAPFDLRVLDLDQVGISDAKNAAIAEARGAILLFVNDDVEPTPDFVQQHLTAQRGGDTIVLGASPFKAVSNPTLFDECIARSRMIFFYSGMNPGQSYGFRHAWNLNLSIDRALLESETGPFSDSLRPCMYEDLELAFRLMGATNRVYYHPAAEAVHNHRYTFDDYLVRESMLGVMAHELHRVNPACAGALFGSPPQAMLARARSAVEIDQADAAASLVALAELAESRLACDELLTVELFYRAHLPLKRRAFRCGLLAAADCPATPWPDRITLARRALRADPVFEKLPDRSQVVSPVVTTGGGGGCGLLATASRISVAPV